MLHLDEFWYSGIHEVTDYESREVGVQIRVEWSTRIPKILKTLKICTRIVYAYTILGFLSIQRAWRLTCRLNLLALSGFFDDYESESGLPYIRNR